MKMDDDNHEHDEDTAPKEMYFPEMPREPVANPCDYCGDYGHESNGCLRYGPSVRSLCKICININGTGRPLYHNEDICRYRPSGGYVTPKERSPAAARRHGFQANGSWAPVDNYYEEEPKKKFI